MNIRGIRSEGLVGITIPYEKEQGIFKMGEDLEIRTKDNHSIVSTDHFILDIKDVHIPSIVEIIRGKNQTHYNVEQIEISYRC
jgi:hypothetical protein